jgi:hypothetical protein
MERWHAVAAYARYWPNGFASSQSRTPATPPSRSGIAVCAKFYYPILERSSECSVHVNYLSQLEAYFLSDFTCLFCAMRERPRRHNLELREEASNCYP